MRMRNETWRLCSGQAEQAKFTTVDLLIRRPPLQQQLSRQAHSLRDDAFVQQSSSVFLQQRKRCAHGTPVP